MGDIARRNDFLCSEHFSQRNLDNKFMISQASQAIYLYSSDYVSFHHIICNSHSALKHPE